MTNNGNKTIYVQYDKLSSITEEELKQLNQITILFDENDITSIMNTLTVIDGTIFKSEKYDSLKELSTVTMKEMLTLYSKRAIIHSDPSYYKKDDPKLHAFLSKLSYSGIETVCNNLKTFSDQFKAGKITLSLTKINRKQKNKFKQ